ncbi:MAG: hypothetical protein IPN54_07320 [Bacteroidetes bacterium]|nr:hypothetical protein [Bacteroidota bacterium]
MIYSTNRSTIVILAQLGFLLKIFICETTAMFYDGIHDNAPDKFVTMGLVNSGELITLIGNIETRFLSYHIYPYNCNAVLDMSNIFECVKVKSNGWQKPARSAQMLGEIGFRAADYLHWWGGSNSFTYLDGDTANNMNFAKQTIEFVERLWR